MKNKVNLNKLIVLLSIALLLSVLIICYFLFYDNSYRVKNNVVYADTFAGTESNVVLNGEAAKQSDCLISTPLLPGDSYSKTYNLKTLFKGDADVYFQIRNYNDLKNFLYEKKDDKGNTVGIYGAKIKIVIEGEKQFEGFFKDLPEYFVVSRNLDNKEARLFTYQITLSLDKEVSSDYTLDDGIYQDDSLFFDMMWWIDGNNIEPVPDTSASYILNNPNTYIIGLGVIFIIFIVFLRRRKKENG